MPEAPTESFRVMTYNIRYDNPNDGLDRWAFRREALAEEVLRQRPAILGMQEVLLSQLEFLSAKFKGYQRIGVGRDDGMDKGEFSPIFIDTTVFKLLQSRTLWLSRTPEQPSRGWDAVLPRIATLVVLRDIQRGDSLWVVNTHFDHIGNEARLHSAELIVQTLSAPIKSGKRVIFMGDLNAEPNEAAIQYLQQQLTDACPADQADQGTFNGFEVINRPLKRIDYCWLSAANWQIKRYDVLQPKVNGRQVSDHFPILLELGH